MLGIIGFVLTVGIIVVIHEWGHYIVARMAGVKILAFSFGFGKVLLKRTDKRGCEWRLSMWPLGGYVKMLDTADLLDTWLTNSPVQMEDEQREALSLWLAEQKDVLSTILKTGKLPSPQVVGAESEEEDASHAA